MKTILLSMLLVAGTLISAAPAEAKKCKDDAVRVGAVCVDKYEASVWEIAPVDVALIKKVQKGKIAAAGDLVGATQRGVASDDYGAGCPDTANGCKDFYAVSIPGVTPSAYVTWFQGAAACRNAHKRLATNQEWQMAALGTPDPGTDNGTSDCNITTTTHALPEDPVNTGSRSLCVSDTGAFDMVGNLWEWVADWADLNGLNCTNWSATYGGDLSCFGGSGGSVSLSIPGGLIRGGFFTGGPGAGVFTVYSASNPTIAGLSAGVRCAREP